MNYTIKNKYLTAVINSTGAELKELYDVNNVNRMYQPSPVTWNRVSPILFPQISRMRNGVYNVNNITYNMPAHGFFRNMELSPSKVSEDSITFTINEDEQTLSVYPYKFEFSVTYKLVDNRLDVIFDVVNKDDKELLYMLGGHPGFKVAKNENERYEDYYLKFQEKETVLAMQVVDGFLANVYKPYLENQDVINLNHNLFDPDAIVLKDLKSEYVDLLSYKNDSCIRFYFSDFNILAIWSLMDEKANYVCLEPWNGIQKEFVIDHKKMGVLSLTKDSKATYSYSIEIIK